MNVTKEFIEKNLLNNIGNITNRKKFNVLLSVEELYLIYNAIQSPKCSCGATPTFVSFKVGYLKFCSSKCAQNSPSVRDKLKASILSKYGVNNISQLESIKEAKKQTCLQNHGVEVPAQSKKIRDKAKETSIARYGVAYASQTTDFRHKVIRTSLLKYGVDNVSKVPSVLAQINASPIYRGLWLADHQLSDYELYKRAVWKHTNQHAGSLPLYNLRGRSDKDPNAHHIDHKYSIHAGFVNNILPAIIGGMLNIHMIAASDNMSKGSNCSITLDEIHIRNIYNDHTSPK